MVPLPGHTLGHAGVAIDTPDGWLLNAGDAYFYRHEMDPEPALHAGPCGLPAPDGDGPADAPPQPGPAARPRERPAQRRADLLQPRSRSSSRRCAADLRLAADLIRPNRRRLDGVRGLTPPVRACAALKAEVDVKGEAVMEFDALMLSRIQFAFTIAFHIIFPAFTIGLASWLVRARVQLAAHRQPALPQPLPLLGEGVRRLLRPRRRVRDRHELPVRHQLVALLRVHRQRPRAGDRLRGHHRLLPRGGLPRHHAVRLGAGRRPAAFLRHLHGGARHAHLAPSGSCPPIPGCRRRTASRIENGNAVPVDWFKIVFNPSFPLRYAHMVLGCYLTTAFAVGGHVGLDAAAPSARARRRQSSPARGARCPWPCGSPPSSRRSRSSSATCMASAS